MQKCNLKRGFSFLSLLLIILILGISTFGFWYHSNKETIVKSSEKLPLFSFFDSIRDNIFLNFIITPNGITLFSSGTTPPNIASSNDLFPLSGNANGTSNGNKPSSPIPLVKDTTNQQKSPSIHNKGNNIIEVTDSNGNRSKINIVNPEDVVKGNQQISSKDVNVVENILQNSDLPPEVKQKATSLQKEEDKVIGEFMDTIKDVR